MSPDRRPRLPLALLCPLLLAACTQAPSPPVAADTAPPVTPTAPAPASAPELSAGPADAAAPAAVAATPAAPGMPATAATAATVAVASGPAVLVHKTATCGCCSQWVDHLRAHGFRVEVRDHPDLVAVKQRLGVPMDKASCHTAEVGGYFVEGHVPAQDIRRLLTDKPKARGITVPGMPLGSPGMETPEGDVEPYTVELVQADGTAVAYAQHGQASH